MSIFAVSLLLVTILSRATAPVIASTVILDINPSIEITFDDDDIVISVTALNNDGEEIVQSNIEYLGMTLDEVLEYLIERLADTGYILNTDGDSNVILIEVDSKNVTIQERIEAKLYTKLRTEMNKYGNANSILNSKDIKLTQQEKVALNQDSRLAMYGRSKLILMYRIHAIDNSYKINEMGPMTIKQLYALFVDIENPDNIPNYQNTPGPNNPNNYTPWNTKSENT